VSSLKHPASLLILDGFSLGEASDFNAVHQAKTPHLDALFERFPWTWLKSCGRAVGLPEGLMGNSEVGHLNMGAGRIVDQDVTRIDKAINRGELGGNPVFRDLLDHVESKGSTLHLLGLLSDGGVHSAFRHIEALIDLALSRNIPVRLHAFLDGRDCPPRSGVDYLRRICEQKGDFAISTVGGRFWGMDRDKRWNRVEKHWRCIVESEGPRADDPVSAVEASYRKDITDEFMEPVCIEGVSCPLQDGDAVFFFNFRADRGREMSHALTEKDFEGFQRSRFPELRFASMTEYDRTLQKPHAFAPLPLEGLFADVLAEEGLKNLRLAETEKYAHVTFFFNGGVEQPWDGEDRILVPSPAVRTYDLQPEMSLPELTGGFLKALQSKEHDAHVVNIANCDMVGHTGNLKAAIAAVEAVDRAIGQIREAVFDTGGFLLLCADHGNVEEMWDGESDSPHTRHSLSDVPLLLADPRSTGSLSPGILADIIPTLLSHAGLHASSHMSGKDLRR
jgi:2,3-bisphosphoglycerate-independent phosphoglycerate mutase